VPGRSKPLLRHPLLLIDPDRHMCVCLLFSGQVVARARVVAGLEGVLRALTALCAGPEGPLPDLEVRLAAGS
jgi:hypothetical protein